MEHRTKETGKQREANYLDNETNYEPLMMVKHDSPFLRKPW